MMRPIEQKESAMPLAEPLAEQPPEQSTKTGQPETEAINCCELLLEEHRRTEDLMGRLERLLRDTLARSHFSGPAVLESQALYQTLATDLRRHFVLEEQALFPVLSQYRTMMLMEVEHEDLIQLQEVFAASLMRLTPDAPGTVSEWTVLLQQFQTFKERLEGHIREEERGIFPLANTRLEPEEKLKVLRLLTEQMDLAESLNSPVEGSVQGITKTKPGFVLQRAKPPLASPPPMAYQTLFEREHSQVQTFRLQAGQQQALHWAGQTQFILVLSGELVFQMTQHRPGTFPAVSPGASQQELITERLAPGDTLTLDSRLVYALSAITEVLMIVVKVWPHPHYTKL